MSGKNTFRPVAQMNEINKDSRPTGETSMAGIVDRIALGGMAAGIACTLVPGLFAVGFFVTLAFTALHLWTSHA